MKEEGEITDDDDDKQVAEMAVLTELPPPGFNNSRKRGAGDRDRHSVNIQSDMQRSSDSQKFRNRASSNARNSTVSKNTQSERSEPSPVPVKKTKPYLKSSPDSRRLKPLVTFSFACSRPCSYPGSRQLCAPQVTHSQNSVSDFEFQKSSSDKLGSQNSLTLSSFKVSHSNDTEIITINDSDIDVSDDCEVIDSENGAKQEDEDLDELQLRHDALKSAVTYNKMKRKACTSVKACESVSGTSASSLNLEREHSEPVNVSPISSLPDLQHDSSSVYSSAEQNLHANDSVSVGILTFTASSGRLNYDHLASDKSHMSQDYTMLSALSQQSSVIPSHASPLTDLTNSAAVGNSALPLEVQKSDVDNYEEVEMDLDSGSNSESPAVSSCECVLQPSESASDVPDQNFHQDQMSLESSVMTTDSIPLHTSAYNLSDNAVSQFAMSSPASDGSSNVAMNLVFEDTVVCTVSGDIIHPTTKVVDSCSSDNNLQPPRKEKDADKKLELLLRAELLQSVSSKRQQQQQQQQPQIDTVSVAPRDRLKATKLQVPAHSIKRTITMTPSNPLPVHQPVVISLTGESSDSNDEEQLEVADSSDQPSVAASNSWAGIASSLDRVLREFRRATEEPKLDDKPSSVHQSIKCQEEFSTFEPMVANEYVLSDKASSLLPSSTSTHKTPLMKNPLTTCNKAIEEPTQLSRKDNSVQKTAVCNLEREIFCERRKLQQQKIALSKTKLKMAWKKEQVGAAEKRVKKLREQLVAAEKITASSKNQLHNLREETSALQHGIEQQQKAVHRLEVGLRVAQKNLWSSTGESGCNSENFLPSTVSSVKSQSSDTKVSCKWNNNTVASATSCIVSSASVNQQNLVSHPRLSTSQASLSSSDIKISNNMKQTHLCEAARMTDKVQTSHMSKEFEHLTTPGARKVESDLLLVEDKPVKRELTSECNAVDKSQMAEQHIVSHTVNAASAGASGEQSVSHSMSLDLGSGSKPCVSKSDTLTQQEPDVTSIDDLTAVLDDVGSGPISSASLDKFTTLPSKKIKQLSHHYNSCLDKNSSSLCLLVPSCQLFSSDPLFSFRFPVNPTSVTAGFSAAGSEPDSCEIGDSYKLYSSSLLCFRSYRFSDFFQQNGLSVSSGTLSHKLDCQVPLCQFDLMGKCLDENCPWQHQLDYSLSNREHLVDIVSYHPSVAGIDSSTPVSKYEQLLNQYVDKFLKGTHSQLPLAEQCLRLIAHVETEAGFVYPHAICTSARCWKLRRNKWRASAGDQGELLFSSDEISEISHATGCLATDEVRYWMTAESDQIKDLEEAVANTPTDESLWIKLAYAKITETKWSGTRDECVSYGLNVLTRAVEANPSNGNLWRHYLDLYMERSHAEKDVSSLFEQAIQYAPSYEFFWKYLQLPVSYSKKMDICKRLRQYLCSPMCRNDADARSHHLLETVLYQAGLCTMSGRFKNGLQVIQAIVQSKASVIWLTLTPCDRVVMWLSFIHLYECRQLPEVLFDPANSNPGPIVRKEAFVVPFHVGKKTRISYETLLKLFESAFSACDRDVKPGSDSEDGYLPWLAALHRSRILLELSCHGWLAAQKFCEELLQQRPYLVDVWLFLVQQIVASTTPPQTLDGSVASTTVEKALSSNPHSVTLFLAGVSALIECGDTDDALSFAERCPISLFEVDQLDAASLDPNLLYCCLLAQPVPPKYKAPNLRSSVSRQFVAEEQANLWLCYCLLLDLQGAHDQATETYHLALSCLTRMKDIQRLWLALLRRTVAVLSHQLPWLSPGASSLDQKTKLWQRFESDANRALASVPVKRCLPHSGQMWDDYSCHNEIIRLCASCVSDADALQDLYEKFLWQMPGNVGLALMTINHLLNRDAVQLCHGLSLMVLHSCPRAASLWNISLRLCQRTSNVSIARSLYAKATEMLPFSAGLWKTYIMFEVINKSRGHLREVLDKCRFLQVNVADFVDSLLK